MDYAEKTFINTVTDGVTTITYTILPSPPTGGSSGVIPSTTGIYNSTSVSSSASLPIITPTTPIPPPNNNTDLPRTGQTLSGSPSGAPTTPSNSTTPTQTPAPPLPGCPVNNGTTYTTQGQTFEILCDNNFLGPSTQGLIVPSLYSCINDCAAVNVGFSQNQCYAASYAPFPPTGVSNCFFPTLHDSGHPFTDDNYISAILIPLPPLNSTNTTSILGPTAIPSASISIPANSTYLTGPTVIPNITFTSSPSRMIPSSTPTVSL